MIYDLLLCKNDLICIIYEKKKYILFSYNVWSVKKRNKNKVFKIDKIKENLK